MSKKKQQSSDTDDHLLVFGQFETHHSRDIL
jgi:hypothetical protein